jgi:hypothetical protein
LVSVTGTGTGTEAQELYVLIWRAADEGSRVIEGEAGDIGGVGSESEGGGATAERLQGGGARVRVERRERGEAALGREGGGFGDEGIIVVIR